MPPCFWHLAYLYLGRAYNWTLASPTYSPMSPDDPPDWTLMADINIENPLGSQSFIEVAHRAPGGTMAGSNHLFNDVHVEWISWSSGKNMRANAYWASTDRFYWRRRMAEPQGLVAFTRLERTLDMSLSHAAFAFGQSRCVPQV